jgi:hypothetical protein
MDIYYASIVEVGNQVQCQPDSWRGYVPGTSLCPDGALGYKYLLTTRYRIPVRDGTVPTIPSKQPVRTYPWY